MNDKIIEKDVSITGRVYTESEYFERLKSADDAVKTLGITDAGLYTDYADSGLKNLSDISYEEATYLGRIADEDYYKKLSELAERAGFVNETGIDLSTYNKEEKSK